MYSFKQWLLESKEKSIVIAYGRMNPITVGHKKLIDTIAALAKKHNAETGVYLSHKYDAVKNPLPYEEKIAFARAYFDNVTFPKDGSEIKHLSKLFLKLVKNGYKNVWFVAGEDALALFAPFKKYQEANGFKIFDFVISGARDPDAEGVEGVSATMMRNFAAEGDIKSFIANTPDPNNKTLGKKMYDATRKGMKL